jgi:hypothetical protein
MGLKEDATLIENEIFRRARSDGRAFQGDHLKVILGKNEMGIMKEWAHSTNITIKGAHFELLESDRDNDLFVRGLSDNRNRGSEYPYVNINDDTDYSIWGRSRGLVAPIVIKKLLLSKED